MSTSTPYTPWRRRSSKALQPFSKGVYGWVFCAKTWQLRDVENRVEQWTEIAEQTFVFACYARKWFAKGTFEDKRHILMAVGSNLVLQDKILRIDAKKPFFVLEEGLKILHAEYPPFEPPQNGTGKLQMGNSRKHIARWCTLVEDVRIAVQHQSDFLVPGQRLLERLNHERGWSIRRAENSLPCDRSPSLLLA